MKLTHQSQFETLFKTFLTMLKLQGFSLKTIEGYSRAVRKIAEYFDYSIENLTQDQLLEYFSQLIDSRSWSTVKVARNGLQFFYKHVLNREWDRIDLIRPPEVQTFPEILTQEEISPVLNALTKPSYRVFFLTVYSMGLRLEETLTLRPRDIQAKCEQVRIHCSKGGKSRMVPLPNVTLLALRNHWKTHRNNQLIFPSLSGDDTVKRTTKKAMDRGSLQRAIKLAVVSRGIPREITARSLRHSYATHLIEKGVDIRQVQAILGHLHLKTTERYTHLTNVTQQNAREQITSLMNALSISWEDKS